MAKRPEISPIEGVSVEAFLSAVPPEFGGIISRIRAEKESDSRPRPSTSLIDRSTILTPGKRAALLDKVAELVDDNVTGRSEMCLQFAALLCGALRYLGFNSYAVGGTATYFPKEERVFSPGVTDGCVSGRR
jgi:hypothetical protein